jgi:ABC-2 type transport system ATP-binding protein
MLSDIVRWSRVKYVFQHVCGGSWNGTNMRSRHGDSGKGRESTLSGFRNEICSNRRRTITNNLGISCQVKANQRAKAAVEPMIQVKDLRKSFGTTTAVNGISFEIARGETFGLLGPNGAGKTTAINLMTGLLRPDAGSVAIDGVADPTQLALRRQIGVAPQSLALYDQLTGEENLAFFGKLYGLAGAALKERIAWCLNLAGLADRKADRVAVYSGGMKRRLNLVVALIHNPAVVFLDEPTVGVDPQSRNHIFDSIELLSKQGTTLVYTTHYMEEAQRLCRRVAIMEKGKILALDTVDGLIAKHGGQQVVEAELESAPPLEVKLPGTLTGNVLRFSTDRPLEQANNLLAAGLRFGAFRIERPNLETVFLNLTGRRLRD